MSEKEKPEKQGKKQVKGMPWNPSEESVSRSREQPTMLNSSHRLKMSIENCLCLSQTLYVCI